tara:strand:+ start:102 stop:503 length:402 start_codon:yes stop_codon:yes gene_type:complete
MSLLYRKQIPEPIEKVELGKNKKSTYYLTANLFYSSTHYQVRKQVVDEAKAFIAPFIIDCPKMEGPLSISIGYQSMKNTNFDLDNKAFFWQKIILDLLQRHKKIDDDNVKIIQQIHYFYKKGEPSIILQINKL